MTKPSGRKGRKPAVESECCYQRPLGPDGFVNCWLGAGPFLIRYADGTLPAGPEIRFASLGFLAPATPVPRVDRSGCWSGPRPRSGRWLSADGRRRRWQVWDDADQPTVLLCTRMTPNSNAVACLYCELDLPEGCAAVCFRAERGLQAWIDGRPTFLWSQEWYKLGQAGGDHRVELGEYAIPPGRHSLLLKTWQTGVAGMNGWSFRLQLLDRNGQPAVGTISVPVADATERTQCQARQATRSCYLYPTTVTPGQTFKVGGTDADRSQRLRIRPAGFETTSRSPRGKWDGTIRSPFGPVPASWSDTRRELDIAWLDEKGHVLTTQRRELVIRPVGPLRGSPAQQIWRAIRQRSPLSPVTFAAQLLAAAAAGRPIRDAAKFVRPALQLIDDRFDCADFALTWLLRWRLLYGHDATLNRAIDRRLLDFIYLHSDPRPHSMCMGTENHRALFLMLEYLTGQRFPRDPFTGTGRSGRWHAHQARKDLLQWIDTKMRYGYKEWGCHYLMVDIECLGMLRDFCADPELARAAERLMFKTIVLLVQDTWQGALVGAQARAYPEIVLAHPVTRSGADLCALLGDPHARPTGDSFALGLTTARRPLPAWLGQPLTVDRATVRERQGMPGMATARMLVKTPHATLASARLAAARQPQSQLLAWSAHLGNGVVVAGNHPGPDQVRSEIRPNYWSGTVTIPCVAQAGLALVCRYDLPTSDPWGFTHVAWPLAAMDETQAVQDWFFGRVGRGFIAVRPLPRGRLTTEGAYAFREITARGPCSAWIVQMGEGERHTDFARFIRKVVDAPVEMAARRIRYHSPFDGELVLSARGRFTVDGRTHPLPTDLHVDAPWAYSRYGSTVFTMKLPDGPVAL